MKRKTISALAFLLAFVLSSSAHAQGAPENSGTEKSGEVRSEMPVPGHEDVEEMIVNKDGEEKEQGEEHRSDVANAVQVLLEAADRDGGIGKDVREIAQTLASSSEKAEKARNEVANRPLWMTLLFGEDYKNLGELRSQLVTTQNSIDRLTGALERASTTSVKAELQEQIDTLKDMAADTEEFLKSHEETFSVFGWFFKMFSGE